MYLRAYRAYYSYEGGGVHSNLQVVTDDPDLATCVLKAIEGAEFEIKEVTRTHFVGRNRETITLQITKGAAKIARTIGTYTSDLNPKRYWSYWSTVDRWP